MKTAETNRSTNQTVSQTWGMCQLRSTTAHSFPESSFLFLQVVVFLSVSSRCQPRPARNPSNKYFRSAMLGCSFFAFARRDRTTNMSIASFRSKFVVLGVWLLEPYASRRRWPPGVCLHKCFSACHVTIEAPMCSDQLQGLGV